MCVFCLMKGFGIVHSCHVAHPLVGVDGSKMSLRLLETVWVFGHGANDMEGYG